MKWRFFENLNDKSFGLLIFMDNWASNKNQQQGIMKFWNWQEHSAMNVAKWCYQ